MFIAGTRFVSAWLYLGGRNVSVDAYSEGSPLDRTVFFSLIVWGVLVLSRRDVNWPKLFARNKWLIVYFLYCLISVAWTDEPMILVKRWLKDLGNPIMALVLLTEQRPYDAVVATVRRLAFFAMPVSVLFIRYYPEFGRGYAFGGGVMNSGVSDNKNTLGLTCLIAGICYVWTHLFRRDLDWYDVAIGAIVVWLLYEANSKTSVTCVIVATAILVLSRRPVIAREPTRIVAVTVAAALAYVAADSLFDVKEYVLAMLGRDATFTNRTELWAVVRGLQKSALVGTGFMSFWAGDRMAAIWRALGPGINQAHNGYLEQYLNLGYVGVAFIITIVSAALLNVRTQLRADYPVAILRLCFIVTAMLYNYTEASFYGINNMWVLLLAASIDPSATRRATVVSPYPATVGTLRVRRLPQRQPLSTAPGRSEEVLYVRGSRRSHRGHL
jgi:O-antigen ligase